MDVILREEGTTHPVEVNSTWKAEDPVVVAKREAAERLAEGIRLHYAMLTKEDFDGFLSPDAGWQMFESQRNASNTFRLGQN